MSSLEARAGADLKEAWAGGGRLWREPESERSAAAAAAASEATTAGPGAAAASGARRRAPGRKSLPPAEPAPESAGALPESLLPRRGPGQHEAPDGRAAPAAPGAVCCARGRVQMQVLPEGTQDPLQRREEAGNEAKVPALRGEDGYHHHQEHVQVPRSGALPASQAAEHQAVHQVVQRLE